MRIAICFAIGAIALTAPSTAVAEEYSDFARTADELVLGHHLFQFPALQTSAFMTTHFGTKQTVEIIHVPDAPVTSGTSTAVDALGVGENFRFGVQLFKRLELNLDFGAAAYSGTGAKSILVSGAGYSYRGSLGAGLNIFRGSSTEFSVRLQGDLGSARKVLILNLLNDLALQAQTQTVLQIINGNIGRLIVSTAKRGAGTFSLNLAQSLGKAVGMQFLAGLSYASFDIGYVDSTTGLPTNADLSVWTPQLAAEAELDIRRLLPVVPLAAAVEYSLIWSRVNNRTSNSDDWFRANSTFAFGLYYSGRRELSLGGNYIHVINLETASGIDAEGRTYPVGRPRYDTFQLTLRYTW